MLKGNNNTLKIEEKKPIQVKEPNKSKEEQKSNFISMQEKLEKFSAPITNQKKNEKENKKEINKNEYRSK